MNISRLFLILITCFCFSCNFKKTKDDSQICNSVESKRLYDVKIMNLKGNVFEHYNLYKKYTYYILTTEGNTYALDIKTSPAGGLDKKYLVTGVKIISKKTKPDSLNNSNSITSNDNNQSKSNIILSGVLYDVSCHEE